MYLDHWIIRKSLLKDLKVSVDTVTNEYHLKLQDPMNDSIKLVSELLSCIERCLFAGYKVFILLINILQSIDEEFTPLWYSFQCLKINNENWDSSLREISTNANIKNDLCKIRALIRLLLNKKSLNIIIDGLKETKDTLSTNYISGSLLMNEEDLKTFMTIITPLKEIRFDIDINQNYLNDMLQLPPQFSYLYLTIHPRLLINNITSRLPVYYYIYL